MNLHDYLIDKDGIDWTAMLRDWHWLLPSEGTVWLVNRFAELVIVTPDGTVHFLETSTGQINKIAEDREDFITKIDRDDNAEDWLMISLVDRCVEAGKRLEKRQCYGFVKPPVLGGAYEVDNIEVSDLSVHLSFSGQLAEAIRDLPDGAPIGDITFR